MKQLHPRAVWLFFFQFAGAAIVAAAVASFISFFAAVNSRAPQDGDMSFDVALGAISTAGVITISIFILVLALAYVWARLSYYYYRYELSDLGFRKESGVIWKQSVTIPYDRIQNVDIYRGILARLLGLSDLHIQTAGISASYNRTGALSEGRLPGLDREEAERLRDELVARVSKRGQGL
ncbi:hypothetical protein C4552_03675 [Candidatus Parcubacteria bacterium]|nr:MAG: hypothetical protein C4552_03675 [Candidatus Parcubacteria bacterium]